jgi:hypothetical protein
VSNTTSIPRGGARKTGGAKSKPVTIGGESEKYSSEDSGDSKEQQEMRRWEVARERMRRQAEKIKRAASVRDYVEIMLIEEVEEGTLDDDLPMTASALDKRKQRIKDWLGHLVRLQLARDSAELARAKFDLTKQKAQGEGVLVGEDIVLDHEALVNWLQKRPERYSEFEEERNALERR